MIATENNSIEKLIADFDPASKVWVYQSSRPFTSAEENEISQALQSFTKQWAAHNIQLKATGFIVESRVIVLMVDETHTDASGCSIDTSVHFIQGLENEYGVELFDRMIVHYRDVEGWHTTTLSTLPDLISQHLISKSTIVINPLVATKEEYQHSFVTRIEDCWMMQLV